MTGIGSEGGINFLGDLGTGLGEDLGLLGDPLTSGVIDFEGIQDVQLPEGVSPEQVTTYLAESPEKFEQLVREAAEGLNVDAPLKEAAAVFKQKTDKGMSKDKALQEMSEEVANGDQFVVLGYKKEDGKQGFIFPPQYKNVPKGKLPVAELDRKTGKIGKKVLEEDEYDRDFLTEDQYERIAKAASRSLANLSTAIREHEAKMKKLEEQDKYPLTDRVKELDDKSAGRRAIELMKEQTKNYLAQQNKLESRQKQLRQEELYREQRDEIKRRTKREDTKFDVTQDEVRRDEVKKAAIKEAEENKAA